ncbi:hypothetical protein GCM10009836_48320 [Pseudonocardia ailaonensis]|uniref:DoxX family protein n=1 Tax=Pseudonocardia ailaonensis TaxID=367279 RepID=A0ABN2NC00_9PSEU
MDVGLLILRLLVGVLLAGHAFQKLTGSFGGGGLTGTGTMFDAWGHRPGKVMAAVAGLSELTGAVSMVLGLLTPIGSVVVVGTMTVAALALADKGLWAVTGGCEVPLLYGIVATVLGFSGPGALSLDAAFGLEGFAGPGWGGIALALGIVAALPVAVRAHRLRHRAPVS